MTDRELRPVGRFEWEQIIMRARLSDLIKGNGRGTRGGVSGAAFMAVALTWAAHADPDGGNIYPGDATVAVEAEVGLKVAQAVKRAMVDIGLTEKVRARSRRQHRGDEYRLTLPTDLLDRVEVLTPAALKLAAIDMYEKRRGKRGGSTGPLTDPIGEQPVGGPEDTPHDHPAEIRGGSDGTTKTGRGGSDGTSVGGPPDRDTNQDQPGNRPTHPDDEVRTALTGPRATAPEEPISDVGGVPAAAGEPLPERCPHNLVSRRRPDGRPSCALCRRGTGPGHLATVTRLPTRTA